MQWVLLTTHLNLLKIQILFFNPSSQIRVFLALKLDHSLALEMSMHPQFMPQHHLPTCPRAGLALVSLNPWAEPSKTTAIPLTPSHNRLPSHPQQTPSIIFRLRATTIRENLLPQLFFRKITIKILTVSPASM